MMRISTDLVVKCPYCGCEKKMSIESDNAIIACCDVFDSGCDKLFVVKPIVEVRTEILKVEGED